MFCFLLELACGDQANVPKGPMANGVAADLFARMQYMSTLDVGMLIRKKGLSVIMQIRLLLICTLCMRVLVK